MSTHIPNDEIYIYIYIYICILIKTHQLSLHIQKDSNPVLQQIIMASPTNSSSTSDSSTPPRHSAQDLSHWDDVFDNEEEMLQPPFQVPSDEDETNPLFSTARTVFIPVPQQASPLAAPCGTITISSSEEEDMPEDALFQTARSLPFPDNLTISSDEDEPQQGRPLPTGDPITISSSSEDLFGPTQSVSFPEFVNSQCNGTQVPPHFFTQETEMTEMSQEEEEDINSFANEFLRDTVARLQVHPSSLPFKPDWDQCLTNFGVLCSLFLQRLLSERFPHDQDKQKKWRIKIDRRRDQLFNQPKDNIDSIPGPSGIKRSLQEKSPSTPKKFKKRESTSSEDTD